MSDSEGARLVRGEVWCRRIERPLPIGEHEACSYCFGKVEDVETGDHARFCDFQKGRDPVNFGFPQH